MCKGQTALHAIWRTMARVQGPAQGAGATEDLGAAEHARARDAAIQLRGLFPAQEDFAVGDYDVVQREAVFVRPRVEAGPRGAAQETHARGRLENIR